MPALDHLRDVLRAEMMDGCQRHMTIRHNLQHPRPNCWPRSTQPRHSLSTRLLFLHLAAYYRRVSGVGI